MSSLLDCEIGDAGTEPRLVTVRGEVDLATAPELETCIQKAYEGNTKSVVLDLEALSFIDSSGLRVLVAISKEARARDASLMLRNVPRHAQRVLDLTGLWNWFDHAPDAEA